MPFLQPTVSKNRFISGLSIAADDDPRATYFPLKSNGTPTTAPAGIAFRGNDWLAFPEGTSISRTSEGLLNCRAIGCTSAKDVAAVENLLEAIADDRVEL